MKFNSKLEAHTFLKAKYENHMELTEEEQAAVQEFFTKEELEDLSFIKFAIEDCFNFDPTDI